jgi:23S rRNA (adenine2503-C2)-methyltransferase
VLSAESPTIEEFLQARGESPYRLAQIRAWIFRKKARDFGDMTDLGLDLRRALSEEFRLFSCAVEEIRDAGDRTEKALLRLEDGERIEAVLLREEDRATACVSTQVGCPVGCPFCASGLDGTVRNLQAHEIVEQVLLLDRLLEGDRHLSHLVFMGIGEPLLNFDAVRAALETLHSDRGFGMGARRITLSTVAPRGKLAKLDTLEIPINLALSLHAPNDALRNRLVPGSGGIEKIVAAAHAYGERTGRDVTFEYVLLEGVNSTPEHARQLARLLEGSQATVNLIPFNPVEGTSFRPPDVPAVRDFRRILERSGIRVTTRKRKGRSIDAACGQLRLRRERREPGERSQAS